MTMPPDEIAAMPDAQEVFKSMKTLMDQWKLFYQMQGGVISYHDANYFRLIGAILQSRIDQSGTQGGPH